MDDEASKEKHLWLARDVSIAAMALISVEAVEESRRHLEHVEVRAGALPHPQPIGLGAKGGVVTARDWEVKTAANGGAKMICAVCHCRRQADSWIAGAGNGCTEERMAGGCDATNARCEHRPNSGCIDFLCRHIGGQCGIARSFRVHGASLDHSAEPVPRIIPLRERAIPSIVVYGVSGVRLAVGNETSVDIPGAGPVDLRVRERWSSESCDRQNC